MSAVLGLLFLALIAYGLFGDLLDIATDRGTLAPESAEGVADAQDRVRANTSASELLGAGWEVVEARVSNREESALQMTVFGEITVSTAAGERGKIGFEYRRLGDARHVAATVRLGGAKVEV
ncbi:MAG: hypothetical protein H6698_07465 [Myxococcales bacterium]|nr:hypothetical protein [Myxococcales bacterium]MCB9520410.1 hypothetical protein [Myxococcales bacterium]MCB9530325.1 hypothetical protein [Myxococcales bacterium]MCB9534145.1 hypothetical protein [Myxococcales bacterium]